MTIQCLSDLQQPLSADKCLQVSMMHGTAFMSYMDCSQRTMQETMQHMVLSMGQTMLSFDGNRTFSIRGTQHIIVPLVPASSNTIGKIGTRGPG